MILLTMTAFWHSKMPYILCLLAGVLLCVICEGSLKEENSRILLGLQFMLNVVFLLLSREYLCCLLFSFIELNRKIESKENKFKNKDYKKKKFGKSECKTEGNETEMYENELIFDFNTIYFFSAPAVACFFMERFFLHKSLAKTLLHMLLLTGICTIWFFLKNWLESYLLAKSQMSKALSVMAVNELYAKKLNQELVIKNYLVDKTARLEERENISRNIHNSVGHSITAAIMTLDAADLLFDADPVKAREKMNTANERIRGSLASIRQAVRVLDLDSSFVSVSDFMSELTAVTDQFMMDTRIKIYTDFTNVSMEVEIPHEHTEFLTGALQELLSNGVRHGKADHFTVRLTGDSRHLKLSVQDNGTSDFSEENKKERIEQGFGLKKIGSYAKRCGGTVECVNENGFKTEILLLL